MANKYLALLLFMGVVLSKCCMCFAQTSALNWDRFKSFVSRPPIIQQMLFSISEIGLNPTPKYFELRYQSNGFYLRQITSFDNLEFPNTKYAKLYIKYKNEWLYMDSQSYLRYWIEHDTAHSNRNEFHNIFNSAESLAGFALNFGVTDVAPGTIKWNGDKFDAGVTPRKQRIHGELDRRIEQMAQMNWSIDYDGKNYKWNTKYHFSSNFSDYIPDTSEIYFKTQTTNQLMFVVQINKVIFGTALLDSNSFPIQASMTNNVLYYSNNMLFRKQQGQDAMISIKDNGESEYPVKVLYGTILAVSIVGLGAIMLCRAKCIKDKHKDAR
jgi:hypothetical protein